jgi:sulfite reductase (NADPH) flavoprotein alpha-component
MLCWHLAALRIHMFCKTGIDVDLQLAKLGGKRIAPVAKCDDDFEEDADEWLKNVLQKFTAPPSNPAGTPGIAKEIAKPAEKGRNFQWIITTNINLNDEGSQKENTSYRVYLKRRA